LFQCTFPLTSKGAALIQGKQPASAWRADILVVNFASRRLKSKIESDLIEHFLEVLNVHLGGEITATSKADGARSLFACFLV
jgi:hypothetical protein